jgi:hypothetical protein
MTMSAPDRPFASSSNGITPAPNCAANAALTRAVADQHPRRGAVRQQHLRGLLARLARAHQQHHAVVQPLEDLPRELHGGETDGYRAAADLRLRARPLAARQRLLEQGVDDAARRFRFLGGLQGFLYLSEDLPFAHDHRVQAGSDPEEMPIGGRALE